MTEHKPPVERLEVHLEGRHIIYFQEGEHYKAADTGKAKSTNLMDWFHANEMFSNARHIYHVDFPKYFRWNKGSRTWTPRAKYKIPGSKPARYDFTMAREQVVGRMYNISPREGERDFLRKLLLNRAGAFSFDDMHFYEGVQYPTFCETCCAMGLLSNATSAVAASLLECRRTAHSVFKIPIPCFSESVCNTCLDSKLACTIH